MKSDGHSIAVTQIKAPSKGQDKSHATQSQFDRGNSSKASHEPQENLDLEVAHQRIVNNLFTDTPLIDKIFSSNENTLLSKNGDAEQNLLHLIILRLNRNQKNAENNARQQISEKVLAFVDRLVIKKPDLFTQDDVYGLRPILQAATNQPQIIFRVIDLTIPDAVRETFKMRCSENGEICPLAAVNKGLIETCRREVTQQGTKEHQQLQNEEVKDSEPAKASPIEPTKKLDCLHTKTDVQKLEKLDKSLRIMLTNGLAIPPTRSTDSCLHSLLTAANFDPGQYVGAVPILPQDKFRHLLSLCPSEIFRKAAPDGYNPLQKAILLFKESAVDYNHLFFVIKELVDRDPESIYFEVADGARRKDQGKNAYRLLKELAKSHQQSNETTSTNKITKGQSKNEMGLAEDVRKDSCQKVGELLKNACIGTRRKPEARKDDSRRKNLQEKLKFLYWDDVKASTLDNVALPRVPLHGILPN